MPDSYTTPDELMREIYLAIYTALESRLLSPEFKSAPETEL